MTLDKPSGNRAGKRMLRYNVDDPADLKLLTENGYIWNTPYVQRAIDAIRSGAIKVEDCKGIPANIRSAL